MKIKISALLSLLILLSTIQTKPAFAEVETNAELDSIQNVNITENETEVVKNIELSMDDAFKLATESNRDLWKIDDGLKEIKEMRKDASNSKDTAERIMDMPLQVISLMEIDITDDYVSMLMAKNGYYVKYADTQTAEIEKSRVLLNLKIEIETKSLYYQVLAAEKTIEINEGSLAKAKEQLKVINSKFNNGSATKAEVLNVELAVQKSQTELDSSIDDLKIAKLNLLKITDLPLDTEVTLKDRELIYIPTVEIDLDEALERAKIDRPEILTAQNNLELQKIETHVYTAYYTSNLRQNKSAVEKLKDAEIDIPQGYKDVELDVRKSYLNLVKTERAIENMDKILELAKEAARVNKVLFENGMNTSLNVLEANTQLAQAEIGRYQLLVSYNINKMMFDNCDLISSPEK